MLFTSETIDSGAVRICRHPRSRECCDFIGAQPGYPTTLRCLNVLMRMKKDWLGAVDLSQRDPLFEEAARLIVNTQQGSTSNIQRKLSVGTIERAYR